MKPLIWALTAFMVVLWSLFAWLMNKLLQAFAGVWSGAEVPTRLPDGWTWPAWIDVWWPREQLDMLAQSAMSMLAWLASILPGAGAWQSMIGAVAAVVWFIGLLLLLGVAVALHMGLSGHFFARFFARFFAGRRP